MAGKSLRRRLTDTFITAAMRPPLGLPRLGRPDVELRGKKVNLVPLKHFTPVMRAAKERQDEAARRADAEFTRLNALRAQRESALRAMPARPGTGGSTTKPDS